MQTRTRTISELVTERLIDAPPTVTLREAASLMDEEAVGALLVDDPRDVIGIFTERDIVRALADGADPDQSRIVDHLTDDLLTTSMEATLVDVLDLMRANSIRHVVVRSGGAIAGVVSMRAVVDGLFDGAAE